MFTISQIFYIQHVCKISIKSKFSHLQLAVTFLIEMSIENPEANFN